jgi:hypothetical protein
MTTEVDPLVLKQLTRAKEGESLLRQIVLRLGPCLYAYSSPDAQRFACGRDTPYPELCVLCRARAFIDGKGP